MFINRKNPALKGQLQRSFSYHFSCNVFLDLCIPYSGIYILHGLISCGVFLTPIIWLFVLVFVVTDVQSVSLVSLVCVSFLAIFSGFLPSFNQPIFGCFVELKTFVVLNQYDFCLIRCTHFSAVSTFIFYSQCILYVYLYSYERYSLYSVLYTFLDVCCIYAYFSPIFIFITQISQKSKCVIPNRLLILDFQTSLNTLVLPLLMYILQQVYSLTI